MPLNEQLIPLGIKTGEYYPEEKEVIDPDLLLYFYRDIIRIPGTYNDVQKAFSIDAKCSIPDEFTPELETKNWELLHARDLPRPIDNSPLDNSLSVIFLGRDVDDTRTDTPENATAAIVYWRTLNQRTQLVEPSQMQISWLGGELGGYYLKTATYDLQYTGEALALGVSVNPKLLPKPSDNSHLSDHVAYTYTKLSHKPHELKENVGVITEKMLEMIGDGETKPQVVVLSREKTNQALTFQHSERSSYFAHAGFSFNLEGEYYTIQHNTGQTLGKFPRSLPLLSSNHSVPPWRAQG